MVGDFLNRIYFRSKHSCILEELNFFHLHIPVLLIYRSLGHLLSISFHKYTRRQPFPDVRSFSCSFFPPSFFSYLPRFSCNLARVTVQYPLSHLVVVSGSSFRYVTRVVSDLVYCVFCVTRGIHEFRPMTEELEGFYCFE